MNTTSCEVDVTAERSVAKPVKTSSGCSICGTGGQLRRGWCEKHYQRWYRNGSTERSYDADDGSFRCKIRFSVGLWNKWLSEFNTLPDQRTIESINSLRNMIEEKESSTWNQLNSWSR